MNRKGVFFTIMALLVLAFILAAESDKATPLTTTRAETSAARVRATAVDNYIAAFEQHAEASMATAGYLTLQNMSGRVRNDKAYVKDINASVRFCMNNKTGVTNCMNSTQTLNASIDALVSLVRDRMGIATAYSISQVWVTEERPFEVVFWMNISYNVSDSFASWTVRERTLRSPVSVAGIEDPAFAYANGTGLTARRNFSETRLLPGQFTNTTFYSYYANRSYIMNRGENDPGRFEHGPSVLQRYQGLLLNGSECCGIETVLNVSEINATVMSSASRMNWSHVDYQFFGRSVAVFDCAKSESAKFRYNSFPEPRFRMDNYHFFNTYYNTSLQINYTCA